MHGSKPQPGAGSASTISLRARNARVALTCGVRYCLPRYVLATCLILISADVYSRQYAIDYIDLATVLTYDGEYDRAREALQEINPDDASYDRSKILAVEALILHGEGKSAESVDKFHEAISATRTKKFIFDKDVNQERVRIGDLKLLHQQLAEVLYTLERCDEVIDALIVADEVGEVRPPLFAIHADCLWRVGRQDEATTMLDNGYRKFPESVALLKQKFAYFAESGLYIAASDVANQLLNGEALTEADYLSFAKVFDGSGQKNQAIRLLQQAKAKYPANPQFPLFLAHIYLRDEQYLTAAGLFEQAAMTDTNYFAEAAEVYRRAGQLPTALRLNSMVNDEKRKIPQQISIFIELEEYEKVTALESDLQRQGLLNDEKIRYALAYSYFRTGDFDNTERQLTSLTSNEYIQKAVAIRQSIAVCRNNIAQCE